jgi:hypothetical protein
MFFYFKRKIDLYKNMTNYTPLSSCSILIKIFGHSEKNCIFAQDLVTPKEDAPQKRCFLFCIFQTFFIYFFFKKNL